MKNKRQEAQIKNKLFSLLVMHLLLTFLLAFFILNYSSSTTAAPIDSPSDTPLVKEAPNLSAQKHHVFIIYTPGNKLHINIANSLENELANIYSDLTIVRTTAEEKIVDIDNKNDMIVSLGKVNAAQVNKKHPDTNKLFITSNPEVFNITTKANKNDAVLYMVQPYCRQLGLIHTINKKWKTVSILSSKNKNINTEELNRCADKFDLKLYIVKTGTNSLLSRDIKDALNHSEALLAIPDKNIYNSKTVKNLLLTSYRFRKPVIAFSNNFVKAGALASIHSSPEQIAKSAGNIISRYFKTQQKFTDSYSYPQYFDVSINSQVFRALTLPAPNINKLKKHLINTDAEKPGFSK